MLCVCVWTSICKCVWVFKKISIFKLCVCVFEKVSVFKCVCVSVCTQARASVCSTTWLGCAAHASSCRQHTKHYLHSVPPVVVPATELAHTLFHTKTDCCHSSSSISALAPIHVRCWEHCEFTLWEFTASNTNFMGKTKEQPNLLLTDWKQSPFEVWRKHPQVSKVQKGA